MEAHNYCTLLGNNRGLNYDSNTELAHGGFCFNWELKHSEGLHSCMVSIVLKKTTQNSSTDRGIWC